MSRRRVRGPAYRARRLLRKAARQARRAARRLAAAAPAVLALWVLSVQLTPSGPVYRFPVASCAPFRAYMGQLLAWGERAHLAPAASCGWWTEPMREGDGA